MAPARLLRRLAHRLGEIWARAGTIWSSARRMSARSSGIARGGWPLSLAGTAVWGRG